MPKNYFCEKCDAAYEVAKIVKKMCPVCSFDLRRIVDNGREKTVVVRLQKKVFNRLEAIAAHNKVSPSSVLESILNQEFITSGD